MTYKIDPEYYYPLHHIRPRFKKILRAFVFIKHSVCSIGEKELVILKESIIELRLIQVIFLRKRRQLIIGELK